MSSLGHRGADKQLSKDFARNREQGTKYRQWKFEGLKQLLCFLLDFRVFNIHRLQKKIYIFQLQLTQKVFSSQGGKELKSYYTVI